ncbi:hypothetical protein FNF28_02058 [Cafeteria roenbergensis]|uniref:Ion transport domain-containing protein n=1 Tax=Cafeteria roenbergensis TaxID=33653 RepID=A0A5A8DVK1_CAFRO|nr:hypothetical protein FNF28_02058 [Cafeteria roenbergensis]
MLENPMFAGQAAPSPAGWFPSADALPPGKQAGCGSAAPIPTAPPSPPPVGAAHCEPLKRFFGVPERLTTASGIAILPGGGGWRGALWRAAYSPAAEALILLVILANIAGMAADTPWFQPSRALGALELGCSVFYTVELVVKVLSLGGFAPYLADPWQSLDAFIVVGGWASELPSIVAAATGAPPPASVQLSALRGLRGLRALRAVRALTGVRELVETLAATLPVVARVLAFNVLIVGCMAAAAVDVFGAALQQRCALPAVAPAPMPATASLAAASGLLSPPAHQAVPPWPWALLTGPQAAATTAPALFCAAPARAPPALDPAALLNASTSVVLPSGDASSAGIPTTMLLPAPLTAAAFQRTAGQCGPLSSCAWSATSPNGGLSSFSSFLPSLLTTFRLSLRAPGTDDVFLGGIEATSPWTVIFFVAVALVVSLSSLGLFVAIVRSSFTEIVQKRARLRLIRKIVLLLILGNTVALGLEHAGMSKAFASALAATSLAMTIVFCLESLLKTVALGGFYQYVVAEGTGWNRFDFFVVAVTALDVAVVLAAGGSPLEPTGAYANPETGGFGPSGGLQNGGSGVNLSVLRVVRVVRVLRLLRLIRGFEDLKRLVRVIGATMHDVSSWLAVTAVLVVTFSVAGMQFFGGTMGVGAARPRAHFDTFGDAVLTVCRMMTGGGTWAILQAMMEAPAGQAGIPGSVLGPLFFVVFTITMNYQLLNFLTVLILSRFALSNDERARKQRERNRLHAGAVASKVRDIDKAVSAIIGRPTGRALRRSSSSASGSAQHVRGESSSLSLASSIESQTSIESALSPSSRPPACVESACAKTATAVSALDRRDLACCCIPRDGWLRRHARHLVSSPWFEGVVLVAIVVSSLALAVDSPDVDPAVASALAVADNVFLAIFWAEMLTKAVAGGFLFGSNSYLRGRDAAWNIIDLVVLVMTSASLGSTSGGAARVGRLGRVMRPLRAIRRNPQMRIVINALLRALPSVSWTLLLLAAVFVVWAILGVSLFAGTTHACNDASVDAKDDCVGWFGGPANATAAALLGVRSSASTLLFRPRVWAPSRSSFDSVPVALATLFEVFTLRSWTSTLYTVVDARGYNLQPRRDANPAASAFLLAFIWLAAVYMGKLFVGVIVGFFRQYSGSALLTAQQAEQRVTQSVLGASRVLSRPPAWSPCRLLHGLVVGRTALFDGSMVLVSLAHALAATVLAAAAAAERIGLSQANADAEAAPVEAARVSVHWAFTGLAALELLVRLMAYGGVAAWAASRSRAELVGDVLLVVLMVAVPLSTGATAGLAAVRLLYVCMRLLARRRTAVALGCGRVRRIAMVVVQALPALANVTALVLLFLFTWAVLGVQLFAGVRFGGTLGPQRSFRTFFDAAMALFGMVLGSDWTPLMDDVAREPPRCTPAASGVTGDCGSRPAALFFFFAWHVLFAAVFSNLYTAAILDQYAVEGIRSKKEELLGSFDDLAATDAGQPRAEAQAEAAIVVFGRIWRAFDRTAVGSLTYKQLPGLVRTLWAVGHPFVAGTPCTPMAVNFVVCSILARQETPEAAASSLLESRIPAFATPTSPAGRLTRRISRASSGPLPSAEAKPGSPPAAGGDPAAGLRPAKRIRLALVLQALQQLTAEPSTMEPFEQELQAALSRLAIVVASAVSVKSAIQRMHARKLEAVDSSSS